ncbi:MAG: hypothetical protein GY884_14375 [Proteobacteria bacterium]|nr:hypothetical protein [Pseudomonadota bacterium]
MVLLLAACGIENAVVEPRGEAAEPAALQPVGDVPEFRMKVDVAFQQGNWGADTTRCQIQVAFEPEGEHVDAGHGNTDRPVIEFPETVDSCAYSWLSEDDAPPSEDNNNGYGDDNWQEVGSIAGPERIWIHSDWRTIELEKIELGDGLVRYEWADCSEETFPFGEVFDLDVPGTQGADVPGFYVSEAFGVAPRLDLYAPVPGDGDWLVHAATSPLYTAWDHIGEAPIVRDEELPRWTGVFFRNYEKADQGQPMPEFEALACLPENDRMHIQGPDIAQLEPNAEERLDTAELYASFQVDVQYQNPSIELPWGQSLTILSTVTDGGIVHLWDSPE